MSGLVVLVPIAIGWGLAFQELGVWAGIGIVAATVIGVFCLTRGV